MNVISLAKVHGTWCYEPQLDMGPAGQTSIVCKRDGFRLAAKTTLPSQGR